MRGATDVVERSGVWPTIAALALLWAAVLVNQVWIFAVLFIAWALLDIATGESHFVQRISRARHPIVFWSVVGSWMAMSILWLAYD